MPTDLPNVLQAMRELRGSQQVAIDLLLPKRDTADTQPRSRYLALVQSLEALDAAENGEGPTDVVTFSEARREVLDRLSSAGAPESDQKWLKRWLPTRPMFSLAERLRRTIRSLPVEAQDNVLPMSAATKRSRRIHDYAEHLAQIRNDLSHGNRDYSVGELLPHLRSLERLGVSRVLALLNFSDAAQVQATRHWPGE